MYANVYTYEVMYERSYLKLEFVMTTTDDAITA